MLKRTCFLVLYFKLVVSAESSFNLIQADNTIRSVQNISHCLLAYKQKKVKVHYNCPELNSIPLDELSRAFQWQYVDSFGFIQSISNGYCWTVDFKSGKTELLRGSKIFMKECDLANTNQKFNFDRGELKLQSDPTLCVTTRKPQSFLTINTCKASMFGNIK